MNSSFSEHPWFALSVRPKREKHVAHLLSRNGHEQYLPLCRTRRRWSDRTKTVMCPAFPGYVFCRLDPKNYLPVLMLPFVSHVVGNGRSPLPLEDSEIHTIKVILGSGLESVPWPFLDTGQRVRIEDGPLYGLEGILTGFRSELRLIVSVTLLQRSVAVEIDRRWIRPIRWKGNRQ